MASRFTLHSALAICGRSNELMPYAVVGEGTAFTSGKGLAALPPYLVLAIVAPRQDTHWMAPVELSLELFSSPKGTLGDVLNSFKFDDLYILHVNGEVSTLSTMTPLSKLRPYLTCKDADKVTGLPMRTIKGVSDGLKNCQ